MRVHNTSLPVGSLVRIVEGATPISYVGKVGWVLDGLLPQVVRFVDGAEQQAMWAHEMEIIDG